MTQKDTWFSAKILETIGVILVFLTPIIISLVLWGGQVNTKIAVLEEQKNLTIEIKDDVKTIKTELLEIKLQLARDHTVASKDN